MASIPRELIDRTPQAAELGLEQIQVRGSRLGHAERLGRLDGRSSAGRGVVPVIRSGSPATATTSRSSIILRVGGPSNDRRRRRVSSGSSVFQTCWPASSPRRSIASRPNRSSTRPGDSDVRSRGDRTRSASDPADDLVDAASLLGAAGRVVAVEYQAIARLDRRGTP